MPGSSTILVEAGMYYLPAARLQGIVVQIINAMDKPLVTKTVHLSSGAKRENRKGFKLLLSDTLNKVY